MAAKSKSSGGDFVLESRHLVGLFLLLVVIFGVVFTLGYLLGRGQYDSQLRAEVGAPPGMEGPPGNKIKSSPPAGDQPAPKNGSDWDFYHSADPQPAPERLQPTPPKSAPVPAASPAAPAKPATPPAKPAKSAKNSASGAQTPPIAKGSLMLQVAAVLRQEDALALAQALQQKKFPAIVVPPSADKYYRVQVGPYSDNQAATKARQDLEDKGFKSIIKR
jgi:cell division septation protein DedD